MHFLDGIGGSQFGVGKQCDIFDWEFYDCDCYQSGNICEPELSVDGVSASGRFSGIDNFDGVVSDIRNIEGNGDDHGDGSSCADSDKNADARSADPNPYSGYAGGFSPGKCYGEGW